MNSEPHSQQHRVNWMLSLLLLFVFFLIQRINHSLTPYSIYLFTPAPFIMVAVLFFTPPFSLLYLLVYTLLFDATTPQSVIGLLSLFFITYVVLANLQLSLKLFSYKRLWIVTQFANVCLFLITSILQIKHTHNSLYHKANYRLYFFPTIFSGV
jgi:hypothetical protein